MRKFDTSLYFITDSNGFEENEFLHIVDAALLGGVSMVQIREKEKTTREYISLAQKVHELTMKYGVPLIVDDRIDVAMAIGAEGVHLGQSDMPVCIARSIVGEKMIVGATAKTVEQAKEAYGQGADYLGVGAIFPTKTKVKTVITPKETLDEICRAVPIPVNAIGGLNVHNIDVLRGIRVCGICVISAIMQAKDARKETEILLKRLKEMRE